MKKIILTIICLFTITFSYSQDYPFVPKELRLLSTEELDEKGKPTNIELVYYEDGTKTTFEKVLPLIMKGAVTPKMYVNKKGEYKVLVVLGAHYSFVPEELTILTWEELKAKGKPTKLDLVYNADGTRTTLKKAMTLIDEGEVYPQMFVDNKGEYKVLVIERY